MKTVLDVTVCGHSSGGVARWIRGLSTGLALNSPFHISIDLPETHPGRPCNVREVVPVPEPDWMEVPIVRRFLLRRGRLEASRAARIEEVAGFPDIIHLSGVQPFGEGRVKVVTFHDDTPWTEPGAHHRQTLVYARREEELIRQGASVMCNSRWSAERAIELFDLPADRFGVVMGAADDIFSPGEPDMLVMREYGLEPGGYLLHVGSFVPRKRIPFLVSCFHSSRKRGRKLVLAGAERWGDVKVESSDDVLVLDTISDNLLLTLYRGAEALLMPSSREGLGLPVLEALACGTPVISSDAGALPETVGEAGLVIPWNDPDRWIEAIGMGATEEMRQKARNSARNTWENTGSQAMEFYRSQL